MTEKIRLFNGPENTNTIGFTETSLPYGTEYLEPFLVEHGYTMRTYDHPMSPDIGNHVDTLKQLGIGVMKCVGVEPPLSDDHVNKLAEWCAQYTPLEYGDVGALIDNRERAPRDGFEMAVGYWYRTPGTWTGYDQTEPRLHRVFDNY